MQTQLPALRDVGLTHLNVSLDTLVPTKFSFITRRVYGVYNEGRLVIPWESGVCMLTN